MKNAIWLVLFTFLATLNFVWAVELSAGVPAFSTLLYGFLLGVHFTLIRIDEKK